jgi:hypothetical protein
MSDKMSALKPESSWGWGGIGERFLRRARSERAPKPSVKSFHVYVIAFDQDVFGIHATRAAAEESLRKQIQAGGPAWEACRIERWCIDGEAEIAARPCG